MGAATANAKPTRLAALLFIIGTVGGAIGGGAVGVVIGKRVASASLTKIAPPRLPPAPPLAVSPPKAAKLEPRDGGSPAPDAGAAAKPTTELCVEVRDSGGRLVTGALINVRRLPTGGGLGSSATIEHQDIGELGVYATALPFPDDVISGQYTPLGLGRRPSPLGSDSGIRTDDHGHACVPLQAPGSFGVTAVKEDRNASVELTLPPAESASKPLPLSIILRLGEPLEALCRLTTPAALPGSEEASEPVSESLGPDVAGRVVDGRGFGIGAVRIEAAVGGGRAHMGGITDGSGNFRLLGLPRGSLSLRAEVSGYAPLTISRRADESRGDLQIVLRPGGGIAGTLRDARSGNLPAGAQLTFVAAADGTTLKVPLTTDGSFSLTGLPIGSATLRARAPGHAPITREVQITGTEAPGQIGLRDLRLELEAGGSVFGQVRGPMGAASATITAIAEDGTPLGKTLTDDRGEFRFTDLPAGRLRITAASSQGRAETTLDLRSNSEERVYLELR